jgi:1-acyl-sn-glycerol-3-phosphate acyltransferase
LNGSHRISVFSTIADNAKACLVLLVISISTIVLTTLLCVLAIPKWLAPTDAIRSFFRRELAKIAELWISVNNFLLSLYPETHWDIEIPSNLDHEGCYLVSCNHRSWVDILVLQRCFNRRLPLMRFFLKRELIRVPFLGIAWWALDFPFMRRDSQAARAGKAGRKGRDLENARIACEKFRDIPVAMMNFPEGTRFSEAKRDKGKAPYRNLLMPRIGGMGQVLYALGDQLDALIDVTIVYPQAGDAARAPTFWDLLTGRIPAIVAHAERRTIPDGLLGRDFRSDSQFRRELEDWMNGMWREKDALIDRLQPPVEGAAAST